MTDVSAGWRHTCATANSITQCWGNNQFGQLGNGNTLNSFTPTPATAPSEPPSSVTCPAQTVSVTFQSSGQTLTCAGPIDEANAGDGGVWGYSAVEQNMTKIIGDSPMNGYSTGPSCLISDFGVHNSTLSGGSYGTCLNYCTVIADCSLSGVWTNIRYTW